jgi:hypothetical protein
LAKGFVFGRSDYRWPNFNVEDNFGLSQKEPGS